MYKQQATAGAGANASLATRQQPSPQRGGTGHQRKRNAYNAAIKTSAGRNQRQGGGSPQGRGSGRGSRLTKLAAASGGTSSVRKQRMAASRDGRAQQPTNQMNVTAPMSGVQAGELQSRGHTGGAPLLAADGGLRQDGRFTTTQREPQIKHILQQPEEVQQNTVSYLRPVKLEGKDAVPIQVQNWTQLDPAPADLDESRQTAGKQNKLLLDRRARQQRRGQAQGQKSLPGARASGSFKTKLSQKQLIHKFDQLKAKQGGRKASPFEDYDPQAPGAAAGKTGKRKNAMGGAERISASRSPQSPGSQKDSRRQVPGSHSSSPKRRHAKGGYLDALADKEAKQISMNSLQVGEEFEKDIKNIIEIIDGVEKNMCPQRLNQQFMRSANLSQNRRKLDMNRTIQAQQNHQSNFTAKQAMMKMHYQSLNPPKPLSQSVTHRFSQNPYGNQHLAMNLQQQQVHPQPYLLGKDANEKQALQQQFRIAGQGNAVAAVNQHQYELLTTPNIQTEHGTEIDGLGSGFDQRSKYRQNAMMGKNSSTFRIREAKRRPLTTKNVPNMLKQTQTQMQKSMLGRGQAGRLSGQFHVNIRGDSKRTGGDRLDRDRSGGENTSDQLTGDNVTSLVTAGNPAGLGKFSSKNFNNSRTNVGLYVTGPNSNQVPANNPDVQSSNMAGTLVNSNANLNNPANQEYEIFSDQYQYHLKKDQELYAMSPTIAGQTNFNTKERIASAKDVIQGLRHSGDAMNEQINNAHSKGQALQVPEDSINNNSASSPNAMRINQEQINSNMMDNQQDGNPSGPEEQLQTIAALQTGVSRQSPSTLQPFEQTTGRVATAQHALNQHQSVQPPGTLSGSVQSQYVTVPRAANMAASNRDLHLSASAYHHGGLADNMTINQQPQDSRRRTATRSPRGAAAQAGPNKLVMQVNKYIPHYQRIPAKLEKRDLKLFQEEYRYKDAALYREAHVELSDGDTAGEQRHDPQALLIQEDVKADRHKKIQNHIINFDRVLIKSFFSNREKKFHHVYRHKLDLATKEEGADLNSVLNENSTMEHQPNAPQNMSPRAGKRSRTCRKDSTLSQSATHEPGYDSDEERENAHRMFIDDLQTLRKFFISTIEEQVRVQEDMVTKFNKERDFFLQSAQKSKEDLRGLQETIDGLYSEILEERDYSQKIWADEQVSLMCQKAMFTFKFMHQNQASKIQGLDIRDHPEGHIVVSKQEQEAVINREVAGQQDIKPDDNKTAQAKEDDKELQKSALASERPDEEKSISKAVSQVEEDRQSEVSALPSPTQEKHEIEIQNLKWQIEYEKKLHKELSQLLENKVSDLMAQVRHLEKDIKGLNEQIAEQGEEKEVLNQTILQLEDRIKQQRAEIVDLKNESEELKQKGGTLSQVSFDLVQSRLTLERSDNRQKAARIQQLEADLSRTVAALKDFHSRLVKLDNFAKFQTAQLEEQVNIKILEQSNRIQQVTETFKDALLLSNKTYFLEEVNKQKTEKKKLMQDAAAAEEQAQILRRQVDHLEQKLQAVMRNNEALQQSLQEALEVEAMAQSKPGAEASGGNTKKPGQDGAAQPRNFLMRSLRDKMMATQGPGAAGALSIEGGEQPPLDIDQFGINSPKLSANARLGQALPLARGSDKQAQAQILNSVMAKSQNDENLQMQRQKSLERGQSPASLSEHPSLAIGKKGSDNMASSLTNQMHQKMNKSNE